MTVTIIPNAITKTIQAIPKIYDAINENRHEFMIANPDLSELIIETLLTSESDEIFITDTRVGSVMTLRLMLRPNDNEETICNRISSEMAPAACAC